MPSDRFDANAGYSINGTTVFDANRNLSARGATFTANIVAPNIVNSVNGLTGTVSALAGAFTFGMTAPASPTFGDRWFNADDGTYLVYLNDGNSNQWVEVGGGVGPIGPTGVADYTLSINGRTGSYTLVTGDANRLIEINSSSPSNLTIPTNSTAAFANGTQIDVLQTGSGQITLTGAAGVTLNSFSGRLKLSGQWARASLIRRATDTWHASGELST